MHNIVAEKVSFQKYSINNCQKIREQIQLQNL